MTTAAFEITALSDFVEPINLLVYGDSGSGKTALAATAEDCLLIATEPGAITARRRGSKAMVVRIQTYVEFSALYNAIRKGDNGDGTVTLQTKEGERTFRWLVIDSLTELQVIVMDGILIEANAEKASRSLEIPAIQDYGLMQTRFKRIVKAFNDMSCNVLYLCPAMTSEDEEGNTIVLPTISGKNGTNDPTTMSKWVIGTVHSYGYLRVRKVKDANDESVEVRQLICQRTGPYFGKDRYGVLVPALTNPTLPMIEAKITSSETSPTPARRPRK